MIETDKVKGGSETMRQIGYDKGRQKEREKKSERKKCECGWKSVSVTE